MIATPPPAWLRAGRLRSQVLDGRAASPLEVVTRLGAVQAQNATAARWAIGVRSRGAAQADIDRLFDSGELLRSWTMRGTLHIVASEDLGWMLSLTSARQRASAAREARVRGIEERDFEKSVEVIADDVAENGPRTRAEALAALERAGLDVGSERGYRFIRDAAFRGAVAWGPMRGKQPQLVPVPKSAEYERDEVLARYLTRYVEGHGPVRLRDFAWWSGLTITDARRALDSAGPAIETVGDDDEPWLMAAGWQADEKGDARPGVEAVAAWDEYVLGYADRSPVLDPEFAPRVSPTGNGIFLPTIVSDGRIAGTWRQSVENGHLVAEPEPFTRLTASERRGFEASIARLSGFLNIPLA
ncbi:winged helix DNA-binding domain-containing protein [Rathayibacter sp. KR2-224]|uniref:winged helix DNA-binding domain-containing protein n=1 Tax=Rathayibacter sp. KR2-224 TaxID=3400913 RepID=UPI003C0DAFA2